MKQSPSPFRFLSAIWLQNFRHNPLATVGSTVLIGLMIVGLVFVSAFFAVGFLVLGGVLLISNRLFGLGAKRTTIRPNSQPSAKQSHNVIEGDYSIVEDTKVSEVKDES